MNRDYKYSFEFDIQELDTVAASVESPVTYFDGCAWILHTKCDNHLKVFLGCLKTKRESGRVPLVARLSLLKHDGSIGCSVVILAVYGNDFRPSDIGIGTGELIKKDDLMKPESGYIKNNSITIRADINPYYAKFKNLSLENAFWTRFNGIDTDVALVLGSQRIRAHKFVLAQGCKYLRTRMYPIRGNDVTLLDCDYKAILTAVGFIYTQECFVESNGLQEVLFIAKKFRLHNLLLSCFELLSPENAVLFAPFIDYLKAEEKGLDPQLEEYYWKFVDTNLRKVLASNSFWSQSDDDIIKFVEKPEVKSRANPVELQAIIRSVKNKNRNGPIVAEASASSISSLTLKSLLCVICQDDSVDTMILPCNHLCLCSKDAEELQQMNFKNCPLCQGEIQSMIKVFLP